MSVNEKDFISFSKTDPTSDEFGYRNRVSRGYYGAFHSCCTFFKDNDSIPNTTKHSALADSLRFSPNKDVAKIGMKLYYLKKRREKADYHLDKHFSKTEMKTALIETDKLLSLLV